MNLAGGRGIRRARPAPYPSSTGAAAGTASWRRRRRHQAAPTPAARTSAAREAASAISTAGLPAGPSAAAELGGADTFEHAGGMYRGSAHVAAAPGTADAGDPGDALTFGASAATGSMTPQPVSRSTPGFPTSWAVDSIRQTTSSVVSVGYFDQISAAVPAVIGAESEVPVPIRYRPARLVDTMSRPGARRVIG